MRIQFKKYQGAGNDFIIIDKDHFPSPHPDLIKKLCDRHFGIGADGLILASTTQPAFEMFYFNQDGSTASQCGNGLRCLIQSLFQAKAVPKEGKISVNQCIYPYSISENGVSLTFPKPSAMETREIEWEGKKILSDYIKVGVPHLVLFFDEIHSIDVEKMGALLRLHPEFAPEGVNVNFVETYPHIRMRTYERGVEQETLACGTGAMAVASALHRKNSSLSYFPIQCASKEILECEITGMGITMTGTATLVFEGTITI